jgi:hypothetical protein
MLAYYGHLDFYESLLELLGVGRMSRDRVGKHLTTLRHIFDRTEYAIKTPFPFATDISENARPVTIDGSIEMICARLPSGSYVLDRRHAFQVSEGYLERLPSGNDANLRGQLSRLG